MTPWTCPRCETVHAPWVPSCTCKPPPQNRWPDTDKLEPCALCQGFGHTALRRPCTACGGSGLQPKQTDVASVGMHLIN